MSTCNFVLRSIAALLVCGLLGRGTSQPCLYNYTIGGGSSVAITQFAPVCLICSNTNYNMWVYTDFYNNPYPVPSGIPGTPYILYVTSPVPTFFGLLIVGCYTGNYTRIISYVGIAAPVVPHVVTYVNETDTLNLTCASVISVSPALDNGGIYQSWIGPLGNTIPSYITPGSNSPSASISIPNISRTAAGEYTCVTRGYMDASTTVVVYYPPTILSQKLSVYVVQGLNIQLNCIFQNGVPLPTIVTWTSPNGSVVVSQSRFLVQSTSTSTSLTISFLVGRGDNGTYTCKASNSIGVSSNTVQLFVQVPPDPPSNLAVTHANSSTISLSWTNGFDGYSPLMSVVISYEVNTYPLEGTSTQNFTSLTSATLIGLHSTSSYTIHIRLVNGVGLISNPSTINYYSSTSSTFPSSGSTQLWIYYLCVAWCAAWAI